MTEKNIIPPKKKIEGVSQRAAQAVYQQLEKGRTYFGSSAAMLSHQISSPDYADKEIDKKKAKEYYQKVVDTTDKLKAWIKDKPNAVLVDSVKTINWDEEIIDPETKILNSGYIDHMIFMGDEIILLTTKDYGKKKNLTVGDEGQILRAGKEFSGSNIKMSEMVDNWLNYFEIGASITGIVYMPGEENSVFRNKNWFLQSFRIVEDERFIDLLDEKYDSMEDFDKVNVNTSLIAQGIVNCIKPYDEFSRVLNENAIRDYKNIRSR